MGEIAELMVNGEICQMCGVELQGAADGFPRMCLACGGDTPAMDWEDAEDETTMTPRPGEP